MKYKITSIPCVTIGYNQSINSQMEQANKRRTGNYHPKQLDSDISETASKNRCVKRQKLSTGSEELTKVQEKGTIYFKTIVRGGARNFPTGG